jgi:hypothetical protein
MHIQGEFRQRVEPLDLGGQETIYRVAGAGLFAHELPFRSGVAAIASLLIACASSGMMAFQSNS